MQLCGYVCIESLCTIQGCAALLEAQLYERCKKRHDLDIYSVHQRGINRQMRLYTEKLFLQPCHGGRCAACSRKVDF